MHAYLAAQYPSSFSYPFSPPHIFPVFIAIFTTYTCSSFFISYFSCIKNVVLSIPASERDFSVINVFNCYRTFLQDGFIAKCLSIFYLFAHTCILFFHVCSHLFPFFYFYSHLPLPSANIDTLAVVGDGLHSLFFHFICRKSDSLVFFPTGTAYNCSLSFM